MVSIGAAQINFSVRPQSVLVKSNGKWILKAIKLIDEFLALLYVFNGAIKLEQFHAGGGIQKTTIWGKGHPAGGDLRFLQVQLDRAGKLPGASVKIKQLDAVLGIDSCIPGAVLREKCLPNLIALRVCAPIQGHDPFKRALNTIRGE